MSDVISKVTVFFENPFWVGLCERTEDGRYTAARVVFGAEPTDNEVYAFFLANWGALRFSPPLRVKQAGERKINPKRMQREIHRQVAAPYAGTKSQQALQLQHEACKTERKQRSKAEREAEQERQFALRQEKKRKKKQGH